MWTFHADLCIESSFHLVITRSYQSLWLVGLGSIICCFLGVVLVIGRCSLGCSSAELVKGSSSVFWCALLVTTPLLISVESGVQCIGDSSAGVQVADGWWYPDGDSIHGHQSKSGSGSTCHWFILVVAWRICLDFSGCFYIWLIIAGCTQQGNGQVVEYSDLLSAI